MDKKTSLMHLGLSEKGAIVYLALLELGKSTAPMIAKKSGIKRPTVYVVLDELRMRGLATVLPKRKKTIFVANSPKILLETRRNENEEIARMMPEILAVYNSRESKPKVSFFEGEKEIIDLYQKEIFQEKEIMFFGSIGSIPENIRRILDSYVPKMKRGEFFVREIQQNDSVSRAFRKKSKSPYYQVRTVPAKFPFPTDNAIFGNKVAIFSYKDKENPIAVMIESEDVVQTYRSLFEIVWMSIEK